MDAVCANLPIRAVFRSDDFKTDRGTGTFQSKSTAPHRGSARDIPEVMPAGLIFHVSRCGSTVLGNALRRCQDTIVLSECDPVLFAIGPHPGAPEPHKLQIQPDLLRSIVSLYSYNSPGPHHNVVLRLHPANLLRIAAVRQVWPDVPCVIVIREPIEIMVSMITEPAGFMRLFMNSCTAAALFEWNVSEVEGMTREEYCGRVLKLYLTAALSQKRSATIVDYRNIDVALINAVADRFGLKRVPSLQEEIVDSLRFYSKFPGEHRLFEPDSDRKRRNATPAIRAVSEALLDDCYRSLRASAAVCHASENSPPA